MAEDFKPHLFVKNAYTFQEYTTPPNPPITTFLPKRDRNIHGAIILDALENIWAEHEVEAKERQASELPIKDGEYVSFISAEKQLLEAGSLGSDGAKLLNIKNLHDTHSQIATVFIPTDKKDKLIGKVTKYLTEETDKGQPKNQKLIDKIESVLRTSIEFLWNSDITQLPKETPIWCEIWLALDENEIHNHLGTLNKVCSLLEIPISKNFTIFPERVIANIKINYAQLQELIASVGAIAEIRRSEELNTFWFDQTTIQREAWIDSALEKINFTDENNYVTILDSGINNVHSLLKDALADTDRMTVDPNWGKNDAGHKGHGTGMAGIALYGYLGQILESTGAIEIKHRLESVKILPPNNQENPIGACHYITQDAVSQAIINNPEYKRIFCMAVTGRNQNDFGKPSTWSASLDKLIFGEDQDDKKLFVVSAGNVREEEDWKNYPESNQNLSIESPAQAWNVITIGAYTRMLLQGQNTLAKKFELSPYSTTSSSWETSWPIKPDVIFEGGNLLKLDNGSIDKHDDLNLLTTSTNGVTNEFARFCATSAATALASNFLARLRSIYPNAWPETLRGLTIHSATWTEELIKQFDIDISKIGDIRKLLRIAGYGIPHLSKAIECKSNYLTFISEEIITPYKLDGQPKTNEIHYYEFPWPKEILENLGQADVKLRITLSYFIEPNPGDRGYSTKYSYQSCALKFLLKNPGESFENFQIRTNRVNIENLKEELGVEKLEPGDYQKSKGSDRWFFGADTVFKGSIHSNYWKGSAAEIADCNILAIYPTASGWWKQLKSQKKWDSKLRYSLIVSIETPPNTDDIYQAVKTKIETQNKVIIAQSV